MDKIQVQTPKGRCEKLQSVDPARRGRSNVSLIYLLQRPRVSPNSVRGALVKLSTKKNRFPHTFSKAPCSGMQLFRTSRGRVQPPLLSANVLCCGDLGEQRDGRGAAGQGLVGAVFLLPRSLLAVSLPRKHSVAPPTPRSLAAPDLPAPECWRDRKSVNSSFYR